ncbi:MAG TPA: hypothetical protein VD794_15020 [Flavisolibacter sp.]|nr:hypothetical protein [Flavisolibacter sp.]
MQLIKPKQISGEIMTLIEEADSKVILVCPYYRISKWYKLLNTLEGLKKRKVEVEFYVRENEYESIEEVERAGFDPICIPNLHTKLYLNEHYGIVSSMNLLLSSENNSLEIAMKTETKEEYDDLYQYYERYLKAAVAQTVSSNNTIELDWREMLDKKLFEYLGREAYITEKDNGLQINTSNRYEVFIWNGKTNTLRISGILSGKEYHYARNNMGIFQSSKMTIELQEGRSGHYDTIWGTLPNFKSHSINQLVRGEEETIVEAIAKFIAGIDNFKRMVR